MEELELEYINHAFNVRSEETEIYEKCGLIGGKHNVYLALRLQM